MKQRYTFQTYWEFEGSLPVVWSVICDVSRWPTWWSSVKDIKIIHVSSEAFGINSEVALTWHTPFYNLRSHITLKEVKPFRSIVGVSTGDLEGMGVWTFMEDNGRTKVHYQWEVSTNKTWMNTFAFILRPLFIYNHNRIMKRGEEGIRRIIASVSNGTIGYEK